MLISCLEATLLLIEGQKVVELRLMKLARGGLEAWLEAQLMVSEKVSAAFEAAGMLVVGKGFEAVIVRYREHVAANTQRLSTATTSDLHPQAWS
ncbi:hypothetical protein [Methylobacterium nodulans]|uniref:Putative signal peptide n=1 Tax=Methylobacterium nodulans (strain LMG 21967 / CNCM I-2342 / ORS 2060) TaxID=460265 RepID=B8IXD2_METNO|nr:putative signal peptide [Methylobacterium nodulans ORS 2060]